jgi:hypothetical protein
LLALKPLSFVDDGNLILVETATPAETCYCSVMGALGEVFSLHAYIGEESFRGLSRVLAGKQVFPSEFFATHRGVSVEFVKASELTPPDRELLKHFKHPFGRGMAAPESSLHPDSVISARRCRRMLRPWSRPMHTPAC